MIDHLDHFVLTISDLKKTRRFYCGMLKMTFREFGEGRQALHFGRTKINLHIVGRELEPKAHLAKPGTADLCFIINCPIVEMQRILNSYDVAIEDGPISRTGASGPITSLYVRDPDLNLIELSVYDES